MHARTLALLALLTAPAALAQYGEYHPAAPVAPMPAVVNPVGQPPCGAMPAPRHQAGRWELRTTQVYVAGTTQQVFVPGQCYGHGHHMRCQQGQYVTTTSPGHYEAQQQWVWVDFRNEYRHDDYRRDEYRRYDDRRDYRSARRSSFEMNIGFR